MLDSTLTFSFSESVEKLLQNEKVTLYCGADPSAQSLHVGNLIPLIILIHFRTRGHSPITLVGGATGIVGDPSGRATERAQMEAKTRAGNVAKIRLQLETFLDRGKDAASRHGYPAENFGNRISTNNADWWKDMGMLQFLGTYGRHIRVGQMLARDSVKNRMESEQGIGFNEFAYQILQAYDFWHLHSTFGCRIQVGGNDQWGNITAGIDLISRLRSEVSKNEKEAKKGGENGLSKGTLPKVAKDLDPAYGITVPLLTTPSGEKFGKSAGNAVWIDPEMTKPYELYQYFVKSPDSVVEKYLKMFTFMSLDTISTIMKQHVENESIRHAQRILAKEVTDLVHGLGSGQNSAVMSEILFGGADEASSYDAATILSAFSSQDLVKKVPRSDLVGNPWRVILAGVTGKSKCMQCFPLLFFSSHSNTF